MGMELRRKMISLVEVLTLLSWREGAQEMQRMGGAPRASPYGIGSWEQRASSNPDLTMTWSSYGGRADLTLLSLSFLSYEGSSLENKQALQTPQ